jgi:hypothetical protein
MKPFTNRVKRDLTVQGQYVFRIWKSQNREFENEQIDLICMKHGLATFIHARGNGHGKLNRMTILRLQMLGKRCGAQVLKASVNSDSEIVYEIIYEK